MQHLVCPNCHKIFQSVDFNPVICPDCHIQAVSCCERLNCVNPATRSIYGPGYQASVCEEHYLAASWYERTHVAVEY